MLLNQSEKPQQSGSFIEIQTNLKNITGKEIQNYREVMTLSVETQKSFMEGRIKAREMAIIYNQIAKIYSDEGDDALDFMQLAQQALVLEELQTKES